jgi:hypothetical protein
VLTSYGLELSHMVISSCAGGGWGILSLTVYIAISNKIDWEDGGECTLAILTYSKVLVNDRYDGSPLRSCHL